MNPEISIIIPAYNAAAFINKTVTSIIAQSYSDWELIIVDDGSKDNTLDECNVLSNNDLRITVIHTDNHGAYDARMTGVNVSKGSWIMFVDSDDTLPQNALLDLISQKRDSVDIIVGTINLNGITVFRHNITGVVSTVEYMDALLQYKTSIGPVAKLFRRNLFDNVILKPSRKIIQNEDLLMILSVSSFARNILILPDVVCYNYNFREGSMRTSLMPKDDWTYLFDLISSIIAPIDCKLQGALLRMKIDRIYNNLILKGVFIKKNERLYADVVNPMYYNNLSLEDKQRLRIIKSPILQRLIFVAIFIKKTSRRVVKRLIK